MVMRQELFPPCYLVLNLDVSGERPVNKTFTFDHPFCDHQVAAQNKAKAIKIWTTVGYKRMPDLTGPIKVIYYTYSCIYMIYKYFQQIENIF